MKSLLSYSFELNQLLRQIDLGGIYVEKHEPKKNKLIKIRILDENKHKMDLLLKYLYNNFGKDALPELLEENKVIKIANYWVVNVYKISKKAAKIITKNKNKIKAFALRNWEVSNDFEFV